MKNKTLSLCLLLFGLQASAQKPMPVILAGNVQALISEGANDQTTWYLSPDARPDVYTTNKSPRGKKVAFYTDRDSIKVKLLPGEYADFVVLLNGKDSCFTRLQCPALKNDAYQNPVLHDTIPFVLSAYNNLIFKVVLDDTDTLDLKFDSGAGDFLLTRAWLETSANQDRLQGRTFQLGKQRWENQRIYPVTVSGQGTVGRFGWNLFDGKVVEIDYDKSLFIVHSRMPKRLKGYTRLNITYTNGLFCIQGALEVHGRKFPNQFLFDNGYQRTVMLDQDLVREQKYPKDQLEVIKKVVMQNGQGKDIPVLTVNNELLHLGIFQLENVPVQLLSSANPARFKTHILGNEVLKRFNTILDFQNNRVYLKPNLLMTADYSERKG